MGWAPDPRRCPVGPPPLPQSLISPGQWEKMKRRAREWYSMSLTEAYEAAWYWQGRELALRNEPWWQHAGRRRRRVWKAQHREAERFAEQAAKRCRSLLHHSGNVVRVADRPVREGPGEDETY